MLYPVYSLQMTYYFFNIASHHKCFALLHNGQIVALQETDEKISDADVVLQGEQLLQQANLQYSDCTHLACVVGPGGFTSLRVAVAYANTLADQLQIPVTGIHTSALLHAQSTVPDHIWLHATKRDAVFVRGFGAYAERWPEPVLLSLQTLQDQLSIGTPWCGELLDDQKKQLASKNLHVVHLQDIHNVLPNFLENQRYTTALLTPWYGREG